MVGAALHQLFEALVAADSSIWQPAISDAAMIIERHARDAYADRSYKELIFSRELADSVLSREQYRELVGELIAVLGAKTDRAGSAAWALGKTYERSACPHLVESLKTYLRLGDDEVVYQLITALDNCGIGDGMDVIRETSEATTLARASKLATTIINRKGIRSGRMPCGPSLWGIPLQTAPAAIPPTHGGLTASGGCFFQLFPRLLAGSGVHASVLAGECAGLARAPRGARATAARALRGRSGRQRARAARYSRDHRPDCKQVCIALVVTFDGFPLGYEVFADNRHDSTTLQEIVETMERRHGTVGRVWIADRGIASKKNLEWLRERGRRYIIEAPKSDLKKCREPLADPTGWHEIREGVQVKLFAAEELGERFILCRSAD